MEKNNSKIIIAILAVLVLCLAGFIVYDKTLNSGNKTTVNAGSDQKNDNNSKANTDNCPKCEKCDNNSSNTNNNYGEKVTSLKEITLTTENQTVTIGSTKYKVRMDKDGNLFMNDVAAKNSNQKNIKVNKAYLTDKFIFFTSPTQLDDTIVFAQGEKAKIDVNNNGFSLSNFKLVDGYVHATGHLMAGFDNFTNNNVVVKYNVDTFGTLNLVVIPAC